jgi:uncharacterized damage-inducible protein DinB
MKNYLVLLSEYNEASNSTILDIFKKIEMQDLMQDRGSFAGGLFGLMDHITATEIFYQKIIKNGFPDLKSLKHKYIGLEIEFSKLNFPDMGKLKDVISVCDDALIKTAKILSENDYDTELTFKTPRGEFKQTTALFFLRMFNHGTHHRGQISQILDEMKIENDYSGIRESY